MQPPPSHPTRRHVLKTAAAALAVPTILPKNVFGANEKVNLAWVGYGGMGWGDLNNASRDNNVVALCDCDPRVYKNRKAGEKFKEAKTFTDFRDMLEKMGDKIDAVGVGTPDHTHFAVTYAAMQRGKHVFVEKPLVHSIHEARTLDNLAKEKGLVTQMGNQGHAFEGFYLIREWIAAGIIGDVKEVITWTDRPAGGYGFSGKIKTAYPKAGTPPEGMDWDLWMGPVDKNEVGYSSELHPKNWRPWWDFGCGGLGDIGCHTIDTPHTALDLGMPTKVTVDMGGEANPIYTPNASVVHYHFPARGEKPPVKLSWYEGPKRPEAPEGCDWPIKSGGLIIIGEDGKGIYHDGMRPNSPRLYPQAAWEEYRTNPEKRVEKTIPRVKGVHQDWINGIRNGEPTLTNFGISAPLTEVIILGTLAIRTGKDLEWDAEAMKITGNPEANALINVEAREGWREKDLV